MYHSHTPPEENCPVPNSIKGSYPGSQGSVWGFDLEGAAQLRADSQASETGSSSHGVQKFYFIHSNSLYKSLLMSPYHW